MIPVPLLTFRNRRLSTIPVAPVGANLALLAHPAYCFSDAAGTVPCAPGDAIWRWRELISGTLLTQATSGFRPILRADGSKFYAEFATTRFITFSVVGMRHIGAAIRMRSVSGIQMLVAIDGADASLRAVGTTWEDSSGSGTGTIYINGVASTTAVLNAKARVQDERTNNMNCTRISGSSLFGSGRDANADVYGVVSYGSVQTIATVDSYLAGLL